MVEWGILPIYIILNPVYQAQGEGVESQNGGRDKCILLFWCKHYWLCNEFQKKNRSHKNTLEWFVFHCFLRFQNYEKVQSWLLNFIFQFPNCAKNWSRAMIDSGADQRWSIAFFIFNCLYFLQNIDVFEKKSCTIINIH